MAKSLFFQGPERIPSGIRLPLGARARLGIEIGAAPRAKPSALRVANYVRIDGENDLLAHRLAQVQIARSLIVETDISIVLPALRGRIGKHHRQLRPNVPRDLPETTPTLVPDVPLHRPTNHHLATSGVSSPKVDPYRPGERYLAVLPEGVFRWDPSLDPDGSLSSQTHQIEPEHSRKS